MKVILYAIAIPIGVMLSPETLVLLGNSAGYNGGLFYLTVALAAAVSILSAYSIFHPGHGLPERNEAALLAEVVGRLPAAALVLSARLGVTLLAATSVLVTAGFAFNEIFLYWFPNFGFAFLLLGLIMVCNLVHASWAATFQLLLVACALSSFTVLLSTGLFSSPAVALAAHGDQFPSLAAASAAVLLFLGFDLIMESRLKNKMLPAVGAICVTLVLFLLWGAISRQFVSAASLVESTVPHLKAAREIMGQNGRLLMGVVVICGAAAAVNGLFLYMGHTARNLAALDLLPTFKKEYTLARLTTVLMSAAIGFFMMSGLAGDENLSIYYRGALLLWLVLLTVRCFAVAQVHSSEGKAAISLAAGIILGLLSIAAAVGGENTREQLVFSLQVYIVALLVIAIRPALSRFLSTLKRHQ